MQRTTVKPSAVSRDVWKVAAFAGILLMASSATVPLLAQQQSAAKGAAAGSAVTAVPGTVRAAKTFDSPQAAAAALVDAAQKFDEGELASIFGSDGMDIVFTGDFKQDAETVADFAAQARASNSVSVDPKDKSRAYLLVGDQDWPFAVPIVKRNGKWAFDAQAGRQELTYRRIGGNELDAIDICRGYVDAQRAYAERTRSGYEVNQYAQRIVSTPGKRDGLDVQDRSGHLDGYVSERIANAIEKGYTRSAEPYHGYFFKTLKGQGPAAPLGEMDFVVEGAMIGGFALAAAPAEYGVTGVQTFIVGSDGVVYQKDLGAATLDEFNKMELFNPDKSWTVVPEEADADDADAQQADSQRSDSSRTAAAAQTDK